MSKQVTLTAGSLKVLTSLAPEHIDRVIITCKGTEPKYFYPLAQTLGGYNIQELFIVANALRGANISEQALRDYKEAFELGYSTAYNECQISIQASIDKMFEGLR